MAFTKAVVLEKLKKLAKFVSKLFSKAVCVFDDIPFLLTLKQTGNLGPFLLVAAGLLIFPMLAYESAKKLKKALNDVVNNAKRQALISASVVKLILAAVGFAASVCLLAFIVTNFVLLAAIASITIPTIMAVVSGIELLQDIQGLYHAKQKNDSVEIAEAKRDTAYSSAFFIFGAAIATLATLSVLSGLSILSLGAVPAAILVAVVVTALAVKIYQILDTKKVKEDEGHTTAILHPLSNWIKKTFNSIHAAFNPQAKLEVVKFSDSTSHIYKEINVIDSTNAIVDDETMVTKSETTPPIAREIVPTCKLQAVRNDRACVIF